MERAEREILEERLKEEHDERERLWKWSEVQDCNLKNTGWQSLEN